MIRIERCVAPCALCTNTSILRITVAGSTGGGGLRDLCDYHARQLVHGVADIADGRCSSCGHTGSVQRVGATVADPYGYGPARKDRVAFSVCRQRCALALADRIGEALTLRDGEWTEWDPTWEPRWSAAQLQARGGRP